MLINIIGGFIVIIVGVALLPVVANSVAGAQANANITGASNTIIGLTTVFFALAIMSVGVVLVTGALRQAGMGA